MSANASTTANFAFRETPQSQQLASDGSGDPTEPLPTTQWLAQLETLGVFADRDDRPFDDGMRTRSRSNGVVTWKWPLRRHQSSQWFQKEEEAPQHAVPLAERVTEFLKVLSSGKPAHSDEEIETLRERVGLRDQLEYKSSANGEFHRVTIRKVRFAASSGNLDGLNLSGLDANIFLRLEDCCLDVLDVSFARLHSIEILGCRPFKGETPANDSRLFGYGIRILAQELELKGQFVISSWSEQSSVLMLFAPGMKARQIQLSGGTQFNGGLLGQRIWSLLGTKIEESAKGQVSETIIEQHFIAARGALRTVQLTRAHAEHIFLAVNSHGIIDLHDARIKSKVLIDANSRNKIRGAEFAKLQLIDKLTEGGQKYLQDALAQFRRKYCPCIDLAGMVCEGEIRFDGEEKRKFPKRLIRTPPLENLSQASVTGHISLVNAKCSVFTDDGVWLSEVWTDPPKNQKKAERFEQQLTFDLNSFSYDFFGHSPRVLFDIDPEFQREDWFEQPTTGVEEHAIDRERDRQLAVSRLTAAVSKLVEVEPNFIVRKIDWLGAAPSPKNAAFADRDERKAELAWRLGFDGQPWTHCARVLRRMGFAPEADAILLGREKGMHKRRMKGAVGIWCLFWFFFLSSLVLAWTFQQLSMQNVPMNGWLLLANASVMAVWAGILGAVLLNEKKVRSEGLYGHATSLWYALLNFTVGFGYDVRKAIVHVLCIILGSSLLFLAAYKCHLLVKSPGDESETRAFNSLVYSIDVFVPFVDLDQGTHWIPSDKDPNWSTIQPAEWLPETLRASLPTWPAWTVELIDSTGRMINALVGGWPLVAGLVWLIYWFLIVAGWWYTPIIVAALSGYLTQREGS